MSLKFGVYLLRRKRAKAKLNQIQTKPSFLVGGSSKASRTSRPTTIPKTAPRLEKIMECHSSLIFIQNIVKAAAVIPKKSSKLL